MNKSLIIIFSVVGLIVGFLHPQNNYSGVDSIAAFSFALIWALFFGLIGLLISFVIKLREIPANGNAAALVNKDLNDNEIWASVLDEFESDKRDKGLYAKIYSGNSGDENKTKSEYLRERYEQIKRR